GYPGRASSLREPYAEGGDGQRHGRHRVLVAAASVIVRAGLETLLSSSPALLVIGGSATGAALPPSIADLHPHVVLLHAASADDVTPLPVLPSCVVLLCAAALAAPALRAGVRALLLADADATEIVAAIEAAAAGLTSVHPEMLSALLPPAAAGPPSPPHASLS